MELLRNMPRRSIELDRVLSDSGQHCVDLSPIKNLNFGWSPNFIAYPSSLVQTFQAGQASNNLAMGSKEFFVTRINS